MKKIYRYKVYNKTYEAFIIKEECARFQIEGNGIRCWIYNNSTNKKKTFKVNDDYKLKN